MPRTGNLAGMHQRDDAEIVSLGPSAKPLMQPAGNQVTKGVHKKKVYRAIVRRGIPFRRVQMTAGAQQQRIEGVSSTVEESPHPPQPPTSPRSTEAGTAVAEVEEDGEGEGGSGVSGQVGEAAALAGPHACINSTTAGISSSSSVWRQYLDRVASFCDIDGNASGNSGAVGVPSAEHLRPPRGLFGHPEHVHGDTSSAAGVSATPLEPPASDVHPAGAPPNDNADKFDQDGEVTGKSNKDSGSSSSSGGDNDNKVLILLDMNGTLLYRARTRLLDASGDGDDPSGGAAFVHGDPDPLHYYIRPGASELVAALSAHPRVQLAFYTSMRGVNALPAARFLMYGGHTSINGEKAPEVYDRPFNARDPHGANSWDTTRDLPLIWSTPGRAGWGFGPGSTIMVDDTPRKMRFMDAGLVVVPEFTKDCASEVLGGRRGESSGAVKEDAAACRQREIMPRLIEYLSRLLDESGADVRPFIERNLFHPHPPHSSSDVGGQGAGHTPATAAAAGAPSARFSFLQAIELVLTTGPLLRNRKDDTAAVAAAATKGASEQDEAAGSTAALGFGADAAKASSVGFEGFEKTVEVSVASAVTDLLREGTAAAERWGLSPQERERLRMWSEAAAATTTATAVSK